MPGSHYVCNVRNKRSGKIRLNWLRQCARYWNSLCYAHLPTARNRSVDGPGLAHLRKGCAELILALKPEPVLRLVVSHLRPATQWNLVRLRLFLDTSLLRLQRLRTSKDDPLDGHNRLFHVLPVLYDHGQGHLQELTSAKESHMQWRLAKERQPCGLHALWERAWS